MRLFKNKNIVLAVLGLALSAGLSAYQVINKTTGTADFTNTITSKVFDRCSGTFFVGITAGEGNYAISKAGPADSVFTPIASNSIVNNVGIGKLALLPKDHITCAGCACSGTPATDIAVAFDYNQTNSTHIAVGDVNGVSFTLSGVLADATAAAHTIRNVSLISTNTFDVFARVIAATAAPFGGEANGSGIATVRVDTAVSGPQLRTIQGIVAGTPSVLLDRTSREIIAKTATITNARSMQVRDMYWDDDLQKLYIAMTVVGIPGSGVSIFGLAEGSVAPSGALTLDFVTTGTPAVNTINSIFAYKFLNATTTTATVDIRKVRSMKTSTGLNYLIINGGVEKGTATGVLSNGILPGNKIYALPLGSSTTSQQGKIDMNIVADGPSAQSCNPSMFFDTPLTNSFQILANAQAPVLADFDASVTVGGCPAPWREDLFSDDMFVVGDTVYVSFAQRARDTSNDPGLWASHAMFDHTGKIIDWTPWVRAYPSVAGGTGSTGDEIPFFSVDVETGKVWVVNSTRHEVDRIQWTTTGFATGTLGAVVMADLPDGVFSMLDLIPATPTCQGALGFSGSNTFNLFGGFEKVLFTHPTGSLNTVTLPNAYNTAANSLLTSNGLAGGGAVISLGYTQAPGINYFLAGTQTGLYMYAHNTGGAFNTSVTQFTDLATTPMIPATDQWFNVTGINAAINAINVSEGRIYVLAKDITTVGGIVDKIEQLTVESTVNLTAATLRTIAQSGSGSFPTNTAFTGFTLVSNISPTVDGDNNPCANYGVISTNDGIYTSTADINHLVNVAGEWTQIAVTNGLAFNFIRNGSKFYEGSTSSTGAPKSQEVWGICLTGNCPAVFQNSRFIQIGNDTSGSCNESGNGDVGIGGFTALPNCVCANIPAHNTFWTSRCNINGNNILPFSLTLWSDGARRFFTSFVPAGAVYNSLQSLPYGCDAACMTTPYSDPALSAVPRVNWIENLSGSGQIVAGTDTGILTFD